MPTLIDVINIAEKNKPAMGKPCNHCGWCCLTEVCPTGQEWGAGETIPCKFLIGEEPTQRHYNSEKHYCYLAIQVPELGPEIGIKQGCCAKTQNEILMELVK